MMRRVFLAALALTTVVLAAPACAQSAEERLSPCQNLDGALDLETQVDVCTRLIDSHWRGGRALAEAHYRRGSAYYQIGDHAHAISDLSRSIELGRNSYYSRGLAYRATGNYTAAIADYSHAIEFSPGQANAYFARAVAFRAMGASRRADIEINRLIAVTDGELEDATDADAIRQRCWSRVAVGRDLDAARAFCDQAMALTRDEVAPFLDTRALLSLRQRRWQEAWNDYDAAVRLIPTQSRFYYGRAIAALRLGRTEEGQADIERALAYDANIRQTYADLGLTP